MVISDSACSGSSDGSCSARDSRALVHSGGDDERREEGDDTVEDGGEGEIGYRRCDLGSDTRGHQGHGRGRGRGRTGGRGSGGAQQAAPRVTIAAMHERDRWRREPLHEQGQAAHAVDSEDRWADGCLGGE